MPEASSTLSSVGTFAAVCAAARPGRTSAAATERDSIVFCTEISLGGLRCLRVPRIALPVPGFFRLAFNDLSGNANGAAPRWCLTRAMPPASGAQCVLLSARDRKAFLRRAFRAHRAGAAQLAGAGHREKSARPARLLVRPHGPGA